MGKKSSPVFILTIIVFAQFCCTSIWFASNGIMDELVRNFQLPMSSLGHLTSAIQFGFITGTLIFALLTIADRFAPSKVFFVCALLGAVTNLAISLESNSLGSLIGLRFLSGFFLAGIYPVGMKIAADYFEKGLGISLSLLVGALVLGTAFPHLLNGLELGLSWKTVLQVTSILTVLGGLLMFVLVPNGPYRKASLQLDLSASFKVFKRRSFRAAAFGYFGHMWELYAFWAFVPYILLSYQERFPHAEFNVPMLAFWIIGMGGLACVIGGYFSQRIGTKPTATAALLASGICCLLSPLFFQIPAPGIFVTLLIFWGMVVIADSPLFSTLVAQNAPTEFKGTALTIVTCIGFAITIVSIQLLNGLLDFVNPNSLYLVLAIGPIFGLFSLRTKPETS